MKLTTFIIILFLVQVSAASKAQITLNENKTPLATILEKIGRQSGYDFIYSDKDLKGLKVNNIQLNNVDLEKALETCFKGQPLAYNVADRTVMVTKKEPSFLERIIDRFDNIDVRGRVVDSAGAALPGATVSVKGSKKGVTSNAIGEFYIQNVDDKAVLVISYTGYETAEVKAAKDMGDLLLRISTGKLEEVTVVSTGYQKLPKERATGSFELIDNKLFNRTMGTNVIPRLLATVPGVLARGDDPNDIMVRGRTTFSTTSPLIILDNMPYEGNINNINPNDVENITVLKDAAAASIWGARAGNGVIVITTKKGSYSQKAQISLNANTTFLEKPRLFSYRGMSSSDIIDVEKFLFSQGVYDGSLNATEQAPFLTPVIELLAQQRDLPESDITSKNAIENTIDRLRARDVRNDYLKYIYRTGINQQYALNINGGSDQIAYNLSAGYDKNLNNQVTSHNDRITLRSNITLKPIKNLEINNQILYTNTSSNIGTALYTNYTPGSFYQYAQLMDDFGVPTSPRSIFRNNYMEVLAQNPNLLSYKEIPLNELNTESNKASLNEILLNTGIKYQILPKLNAEIRYQFQRATGDNSRIFDAGSFNVNSEINAFTNPITNIRAIPLGGFYESGNSLFESHVIRGTVNYEKKWAGKNQFVVLSGGEARKNETRDQTNGTLYGYDTRTKNFQVVDTKTRHSNFFGGERLIPYNPEINNSFDRFTSLFLNASYTYLEKYILSGSVRKDASNTFGDSANKQGSPLWSGGVSWIVSKESFLKSDYITFLKLRATYGYSGNVVSGVPAYAVVTYSSTNDPLTGLPIATAGNAPNPNLRWEKVGQLNLGIDYGIFSNAIIGSIEYFRKNSTDIVTPSPVDLTTGFATQTINSADLKGRGFDFTLNSKNLSEGTFQWNTNFIYSYNRVNTTKYKVKLSTIQYISNSNGFNPIEGKDAYAVFAYYSAGLDPLTGDPRGYLNGEISNDYYNLSINSVDQLKYYGSSIPRHFGAVRNRFAYKNLEISCNITYKFGFFFRRPAINYSDLFSTLVGDSEYTQRWKIPGDEFNTSVPSMIYGASSYRDFFYINSTDAIEKGDLIRFQDITMSIKLPDLKGFKNLVVSGVVNNLGLIWTANKKKMDPDYFGRYKPSRTYAIGITANF